MNMRSHDIPQMEPLFGEEERAAVDAYLRDPGYITEFKKTAELEAALGRFLDAKHCVVVNSGTVSLLCAGLLLELAPGDEVIVPNYTMIASANAFRAVGATIKFADVERETLCLDLESAKRALTPQTRAIVFVNANGRY